LVPKLEKPLNSLSSLEELELPLRPLLLLPLPELLLRVSNSSSLLPCDFELCEDLEIWSLLELRDWSLEREPLGMLRSSLRLKKLLFMPISSGPIWP